MALPLDLWKHTSTFLYPKDIIHLRLTCRKFKEVIKTIIKVDDESQRLTRDNWLKRAYIRCKTCGGLDSNCRHPIVTISLMLSSYRVSSLYDMDCITRVCSCARFLPTLSKLRLNTHYGFEYIDMKTYVKQYIEYTTTIVYTSITNPDLPSILQFNDHYWLLFKNIKVIIPLVKIIIV